MFSFYQPSLIVNINAIIGTIAKVKHISTSSFNKFNFVFSFTLVFLYSIISTIFYVIKAESEQGLQMY